MPKDARTIIIGLDGVPFGLLENLANTGVMPNTTAFIRDGVFKEMMSSIPEVSSVAWSSMITGANPAQHGIFGFTELAANSYQMRFPNFNDLKVQPFWNDRQGPSVIINVPSTYPVRPMNGVLISGFVSIDFNKSIHPVSLVSKLKSFNYRLDVDSQKAHKSLDLFMADLDETLDARIEAYRYLWDYCDWQTFMLVFTGTDRLMHFLWYAYEQLGHKYHQAFLDHFRRLDEVIGEISGRISDNDRLIMLSDHGFEQLEKDVYVNLLLLDAGFLQFKKDQDMDLKNIYFGTKAFALDPARIHVNLKGKYPCGSVEPKDKEEVLSEIEKFFGSFSIDGNKVFEHVFRKEQIYDGPYLDEAPDLVLVGAKGFNLKAGLRTKQAIDKGIFTGKHTLHDAFLLVRDRGGACPVGDKPSVYDIAKII